MALGFLTAGETALLLVATGLITAGSAMDWHVNRNTAAYSDSINDRGAHTYASVEFPFMLLTVWSYVVTSHYWLRNKNHLGNIIWEVTFYGSAFYLMVNGQVNWQSLDDFRASVQHGQDLPVSNFAFFYTFQFTAYAYEDTKKLLAAGILNYTGLFLLFFVVNGAFRLRLNIQTYLLAIAWIFAVIGVVIFWDITALSHAYIADEAQLTNGNANPRYFAFQTCSSLIATLLILEGAVIHERRHAAQVAMIFLASYGVWYLSNGFATKGIIQASAFSVNYPAANSEKDIRFIWAGSLFCWFSAIVALVAGYLECASPAPLSSVEA